MALSNLVIPTVRYEYTHMIRVPEIFFGARRSWKLTSLSISRCLTLPGEPRLFKWISSEHAQNGPFVKLTTPDVDYLEASAL